MKFTPIYSTQMAGFWLILAMTTPGAIAQTNDSLPLLTDCSAPNPQSAGIAATIHQSDPVHVRYSIGGNTQTCYAVSAMVNGETVEGYLLGSAHRDVADFEREARSRVPAIPSPEPPKPAPAPAAQDAQEKTLVPEGPKSFAGLSGTSPDGRRVSLDNISAPTVVLYFWSANDKKSIREADGMEGVFNLYRNKGVGLVGVVSGASAASVRRVLHDEEVLWPQILDNGDIPSRYPVSKDAKYYILDRHRNAVAALKSAGEVQRALMKMRQP